MYEQFYGLKALPFAAKPAAGEYYFSEHQRKVLEDLEARVGQGNCVCVLSGADGVGKTTLVESLCEHVSDAVGTFRIDAVQMPGERSLAQKIIAALSVEVVCDEQSSDNDHLAAQLGKLSDTDRKIVLIIDNADDLTAADSQLLASLLAYPNMQMLLVVNQAESDTGQTEFSDLPESDQAVFNALAGSIVQHFALAALNPVETDTYIRVRLIQAGASPELFTPAASEAIYHYSGGLPRMINRICDLALVYGYSRQSREIDKQVMDFVLNDRWGGGQQTAGDMEGVIMEADSTTPKEPTEARHSADETVIAGARNIENTATPDQVQNQQVDINTPDLADSAVAQQLVELLRRNEQQEVKTEQPNERDIYEFIRLSMKYHQRHLERFTIGVVAGVVLLVVGGIWGFMAWQSTPEQSLADAAPAKASEGSIVTWETPRPEREAAPVVDAAPPQMRAGVTRLIPLSDSSAARPQTLEPTVEQAALETSVIDEQKKLTENFREETRALQAEQEKLQAENRRLQEKLKAENRRLQEQLNALQAAETDKKPVASTGAGEQKKHTASIQQKDRALEAEQKRLDLQRKRLQKKLAAQRAENDRLKRASQREQERALKAQSLLKEARKNVHMTWDKVNASTPDAFPEE